MARELQAQERMRIQDLVDQLESMDQRDAAMHGLDWPPTAEGPEVAGKMRELLVQYLSGRAGDRWAMRTTREAAKLPASKPLVSPGRSPWLPGGLTATAKSAARKTAAVKEAEKEEAAR